MVLLQVIDKHCDKWYIAVFQFPNLAECSIDDSVDLHANMLVSQIGSMIDLPTCAYLGVLPVQFSKQLQNFINCLLHQYVMQEVLDEGLRGCKLDLLSLHAIGRIALVISVLQHQLLPGIEVLSGLLASHDLHLERPEISTSSLQKMALES